MKKILTFLKSQITYYFYSFLNLFVKKNKYQIFLFDKYLKKDNVWHIANYIANQPHLKKYTVYYYTEVSQKDFSNIRFVNKEDKILRKLFSSKYVMYSYRGDDVIFFKSSRSQKIIDTMHGSPLKKVGYEASASRFNKLWKHEKTYDYMLNVSEFLSPVLKASFNAADDQILTIGYPRNDAFFEKKEVWDQLKVKRENYQKVLLWMPTWRKSIQNTKRAESVQDFPLLNDENFEEFNEFLKERKTLLIIKPHPFQAALSIFNKEKSHIKIISNEELNEAHVELYSLLNEVDALLTDYSSVYFDFLLTLKPIGFAIDDFESYEGKRGFMVEDPLAIMPGEKIKTFETLKQFIIDINEGKDNHYQERVKINNLVNKYQDGNSTKRLADFLGW